MGCGETHCQIVARQHNSQWDGAASDRWGEGHSVHFEILASAHSEQRPCSIDDISFRGDITYREICIRFSKRIEDSPDRVAFKCKCAHAHSSWDVRDFPPFIGPLQRGSLLRAGVFDNMLADPVTLGRKQQEL